MERSAFLRNIKTVVRNMMKQRSIENFSIKFDEESNANNGYLGEIILLRIEQEDGFTLEIVLKASRTNEIVRNSICVDESFERELALYSQLIPALTSYLERNHMDNFIDFVPKVYFTSINSNPKCILMENLTVQNYKLYDRQKTMNIPHLQITLENYGKWHGLTMSFRDEYPQVLSKITKEWSNVRGVLQDQLDISSYMKETFQRITHILKERGRSDLVAIYSEFENQIDSVLHRKCDEKDRICVVHGDPWINNFMYKYENPGDLKPQAVCFLDFQFSMLDSPVVDISNFFYNVADKTAYNNFENLLSIYYESLATTMKSLGSDPDKLFTMKDLKRHWKTHGIFGVLTALIHMKIQLCEANEAPDFNKLAENGEKLAGSFGFRMKNSETFEERMLDIFVHYGEFLKFQSH